MNTQQLQFDKVSFLFRDNEKSISVFDKVDSWNNNAGYTTKKRPYKKFKTDFLNKELITNETTFSQAISLLNSYGLDMHTWCMND